MSAPLLSVIVPVYNTEKYLRRCIDSILSQTFTDFELLLIDDGSTDASPAICDEYVNADSRVRVFHKPNGGVSSARNLGLDNANGEWVTFIDSDDYVTPSLLEDYASRFSTNADLYIQGYIDVNGGNLHKMFKNEFLVFDDCFKESESLRKRVLYSYTFNKLFRIDYIRRHNIRFDSTITMIEDTIFVFQYLTHIKSVCHIHAANYFYEVNETSATKKSHSASSWSAWYNTFVALYLPYVHKDSEFVDRELKHIWYSMVDMINDKYFYKSSYGERKHMINTLRHSPYKPHGIYEISAKGVISFFINYLPIPFTDAVLYAASRFKLRNRSNRLANRYTKNKYDDVASYIN